MREDDGLLRVHCGVAGLCTAGDAGVLDRRLLGGLPHGHPRDPRQHAQHQDRHIQPVDAEATARRRTQTGTAVHFTTNKTTYGDTRGRAVTAATPHA